ncbi:MAG: hypothetical protein ACYSU0_11405 [Planctomycetota bacterium]|jgi:hypothetical protein
MKTGHKVLLGSALALVLIMGLLAGPYVQLGREPVSALIRDVRLYILAFEVRDADTDQVLNVTIGHGASSYPHLVEMPPNGPYRVSSVGTAPPEVRISRDGYESATLSLEEFATGQAQAGKLTIRTVRLRRLADPSRAADAADDGKGDVSGGE